MEPTSFIYEEIKDQKAFDVMSRMADRDNWEEYALKIGDIFVKPHEKIEKARALFEDSKHSKIKVVGTVIKEYHLFKAFKKLILT